MCSKHRYLLIMACSQRKRSELALLPAIERYDGPAFRVLRRFLKEQTSELLDILILSAKFGLILDNQLIPNYDQRLTPTRARELHPHVISELRKALSSQPYQKLCICMGKEYLQVLDGYNRLVSSEMSIKLATGPPGKKLAELHNWLYAKSSPQLRSSQVVVSNGKARLRGIEVTMTPAQVLDKARQALKEGYGNPAGYQSWYVLLDGQRVAPKWLVSQLTGLSVADFQAREARNLLQHLGIGVYRV